MRKRSNTPSIITCFTKAMITWPTMHRYQSFPKWTTPRRRILEHPNALPPQQPRTRSRCPDDSHLVSWLGALQDCSFSHPQSGENKPEALHHRKTYTTERRPVLVILQLGLALEWPQAIHQMGPFGQASGEPTGGCPSDDTQKQLHF